MMKKGTTMCLCISVCLIVSGALHSADSRIHRKPDFAKYAPNAVKKAPKIQPITLPWLQKETPIAAEKPVALPWRNKEKTVAKVKKKPPSKKQVTYVKPAKKAPSIDTAKELPIKEVAQKKISIKDVVAERERARTEENDNESFFSEETEIASNEELGEVRGGMVAANGMVFDIGLFHQTIVNGVIVDEVGFTTDDLLGVNPATGLQRQITISESGDVDIVNIDVPEVPAIYTAVQSNLIGGTVDYTTTLNINVNDASAFLQQSKPVSLDEMSSTGSRCQLRHGYSQIMALLPYALGCVPSVFLRL